MALAQRDWAYVEERLLSPAERLGEAITRLRNTNHYAEAERLFNAQRQLADECRAVRSELRKERYSGPD